MEDCGFSSIEEVNLALVRGRYEPNDLYNIFLRGTKLREDGTRQITGSESEFHNLGATFARSGNTMLAAGVAKVGVEIYPLSTDLLADIIKYSSEIGDIKSSRRGVEMLTKVDRKFWTWRTFTFAIDYFKDSRYQCSSANDIEKNFEDAFELIREFKKYIPFEERAYVAEAEIYEILNEYQKKEDALLEGIRCVAVAPQCCMKLADYYLELGKYDLVVKYAQYAILAASQDQPSISLGYVYFIYALALDAIRIKKIIDGDECDLLETERIVTALKTADNLFVSEGRKTVSYRQTIEAKLIAIRVKKGENPTASEEKEKKELLSMINNIKALMDSKTNGDIEKSDFE